MCEPYNVIFIHGWYDLPRKYGTLTHSRKEVIFIALTYCGQMLYCKTEKKSLYNENSCIMSFNVVVIDRIVVQVDYKRTVFEMNGRHWFIEVHFL